MTLRVWIVRFSLLLFPTAAAQDAASIRALIERLDAERIEDRTRAASELKRIGSAAIPELEKAERDSGPERAGRAKSVLRAIRLRASMSPVLLAAVPDADDRLADGKDEEWTRVFLGAAAVDDGKPRFPDVCGDDLEALASRALLGAADDEERVAVLGALGRLRISAVASQVAELLSTQNDDLREAALMSLGGMGAREFHKAVEACLTDGRGPVREKAIWALGTMRSLDSAPALQTAVSAPFPDLVPTAVRHLGDLDAQEAIPKIVELLDHADARVRAEAVIALGSLGARARISEILRLGSDPSPDVRIGVALALGSLGAADQADVLLKLLKDEVVRVRRAAAQSLGSLRASEAAPTLARVLREEVWFPLRSAAAGALCELRSRDGVAFILGESHEFTPLNALRRPAAWKHLASRRVTREAEGSVRKLLELLAQDGGVTLEIPSEPDPEMRSALRQRAQLRRKGRSTTLISAIRSITLGWAEVVVEDRSVRLIPRSQAVAFWKAWASEPR